MPTSLQAAYMSETTRRAAPPTAQPGAKPLIPTPPSRESTRDLVVGRGISLSGEITSCDRLVVEGSIQADLSGCQEVTIAETGLFKGSATIDHAEIRGRFEGNLTVQKRLSIQSTGRVTGSVRYGQLEIVAGGQISGDIQALQGDEPAEGPRPTGA